MEEQDGKLTVSSLFSLSHYLRSAHNDGGYVVLVQSGQEGLLLGKIPYPSQGYGNAKCEQPAQRAAKGESLK